LFLPIVPDHVWVLHHCCCLELDPGLSDEDCVHKPIRKTPYMKSQSSRVRGQAVGAELLKQISFLGWYVAHRHASYKFENSPVFCRFPEKTEAWSLVLHFCL
jgi:hypothetical protein